MNQNQPPAISKYIHKPELIASSFDASSSSSLSLDDENLPARRPKDYKTIHDYISLKDTSLTINKGELV